MRESKPFWRDVPLEVRREIENYLGSPVIKAYRVFGGFGPSATFRLILEDGRTIFAKGAGKGSTSVNWSGVEWEEWVYQNIEVIRPLSPAYFGSVKTKEWHLLFLEDLTTSHKVPPWTEELAIKAVHDIAKFHLCGIAEEKKVKSIITRNYDSSWKLIKDNRDELSQFLALFKENSEMAKDWLHDVIDILIATESEAMRSDQPWGLIHCDIRSDNLCFQNRKLVLFDWAVLCSGPLILDIIFFFPSVMGEGGPSSERLLPEYKKIMEKGGIIFPDFAERAATAFMAGFFAGRAGKPPIPGLPRLRQIQRLQLRIALQMVAKTLNLPKPPDLEEQD
ncbi:phosphotransferase [Risungbinella massiliensis]|uniref:phosphotransferase n=1 Tax=Risungbinella massiliensis TaxID=1329796 RepID=UPI0005CBFCE1|nr:phosphotransferase [Risungbinella massiliensis]